MKKMFNQVTGEYNYLDKKKKKLKIYIFLERN